MIFFEDEDIITKSDRILIKLMTHVAEIASVWMINRDFAKC